MLEKTKRPFGVELEVATSKKRFEIKDALVENKIEAIESYYGSPDQLTAWKVHEDGSLNRGWEIVSPPMDNFSELETVVETLRKQLHCRCNQNTGFHIHIDISDFNMEQYKNLYRLYNKYEQTVLKTIIDPRRFKNHYCRPVTRVIAQIEEFTDIENYKNYYFDRYISLNPQALRKHGTIEFRQHQGTIHYNEIYSWVVLTQAFVEAAANFTGEMKALTSETPEGQLKEMFEELNITDKFTIKHYQHYQKYILKKLAA